MADKPVSETGGTPIVVNQTEAGGVAWCDIYGLKKDEQGLTHEVKISITSRGANPEMALRELMRTLAIARDEFKMHPYPPFGGRKENVTQPAAQPAAQPVSQPVAAPETPAGSPAPAAAHGSPAGKPEPQYAPIDETTGVIIAVKMVVTPRADGKTKVEFFGAGRKYADLSAVMTPEQLAGMMAVTGAWTPDHFKTLATYDVNYKVSWKNSDRKNQAGNFYKNITGLALA